MRLVQFTTPHGPVYIKPDQIIAIGASQPDPRGYYRTVYLAGGQWIAVDDTPENMAKAGLA